MSITIDTLLDDPVEYDASLENYREVFQKITAFYIMERYPFVIGSKITEEDVRTSLNQVKGVIEKLRKEVIE